MRSRSDSLTAAGTLAFGLYAGGGTLGMPAIPGFMSCKDKILPLLTKFFHFSAKTRKNDYFCAKDAEKVGKKY